MLMFESFALSNFWVSTYFYFSDCPSQQWLVQSRQWEHQISLWNQLKVNNKEIKTTSLTTFWYLFYHLRTDFKHCFGEHLIITFSQNNENLHPPPDFLAVFRFRLRPLPQTLKTFHRPHSPPSPNSHKNSKICDCIIWLQSIVICPYKYHEKNISVNVPHFPPNTNFINYLTHYSPVLLFYTPWKH